MLDRLPAAPGVPIEAAPPLHDADQDIEMNMDERGGGQLATEQRMSVISFPHLFPNTCTSCRDRDDLSDREEDGEDQGGPASKRIRTDQGYQVESSDPVVSMPPPPPPQTSQSVDVNMKDEPNSLY